VKRAIEKATTYLMLGGFVAFSIGVILLIVTQAFRNCLPFEFTIILIGLALVMLGIFAAKIFGDIHE
jgi:VIT1/CCC1 family predicted Fe2+/Mn2+ transporter